MKTLRVVWGGGGLLCLLLGASVQPAAGQEVPCFLQKWEARQFETGVNATDEALDVVYLPYDPDGTGPEPIQYNVFACGYLTGALTGGQTYTRFAVFKYDATYPDIGTILKLAEARYPTDPPSIPEEHKAVAIAVNRLTSDVYVVGPSRAPAPRTDLDYRIIKYNFNLVAQWSRTYDGGVLGDDVPVDVRVLPDGDVVVTGTAQKGAPSSSKDIVTIRYNPDGSLDVLEWPALVAPTYVPEPGAEEAGIRRYNNDLINGDDRAAELADPIIAVDQAPDTVYVAGTSWGGDTPNGTKDDFVTINYSEVVGSILPANFGWLRRYDHSGGDDQATGIAIDDGFSEVYVCGATPPPPPTNLLAGSGGSAAVLGSGMALSSTAPPNRDYLMLEYRELDGVLNWNRTWDYAGHDDVAADIQYAQLLTVKGLWVTGRVQPASGIPYDVGTMLLDPTSLTGAPYWTAALGFVAGRDDRGAMLAPIPHLADSDKSAYIGGLTQIGSPTSDDGLATRYLMQTTPPSGPWCSYFHDPFIAADRFAAITQDYPLRVGEAPAHNVYAAGTSFKPGQGLDFVIVRIRRAN